MTPTDQQIEAAVLLKFMTKLTPAHLKGTMNLADFANLIDDTASEIREHAAHGGATPETQEGMWEEAVQMIANKILEATGDESSGAMMFQVMPPILADPGAMDDLVSTLAMKATAEYAKEFPQEMFRALSSITNPKEADEARAIIATSMQRNDA